MVQLNLVPDIKAEYINSRRQKRTVMLLAAFVIGGSLGVTILLAFIVYGVQGFRINSLEDSIDKKSAQISSVESIEEILTIQNQLSALDGLHASKPATTRLLTYLSQVIPNNTVLTDINVDLSTNQINVDGTTDSLQDINKLVDTFKFVEITRGDPEEVQGERQKAFSVVVLESFERVPQDSSFSITMQFDPIIFDRNEKQINLVVPAGVSTRSTTEQPRVLFDASAETVEETR